MKNLSIIACISQDHGLGFKNNLIWHIKPDMQFFRTTTLNHPVVMGKNTYLSLGRSLPKRENIVLSRSPIDADGIKVFQDKNKLDEYLDSIEGEKFIIGGAALYSLYIDAADTLYLTEVQSSKPADVFFPEFDRKKFDRTVLKTGVDDGIMYEIVQYARRKND